MNKVKIKNIIAPVLETRHLTRTTYVLRVERSGLDFDAGQYISIGMPDTADKRVYSIYSGINDKYLEILVKEIDEGMVSRQLKVLRPGAKVEFEGPSGFFTLGSKQRRGSRVVLVASGTGISPFHSYVRSYSSMDYLLFHGVRFGDEAYESESYDQGRYILCTSGDNQGSFQGRVTDYLRQQKPDMEADYYLCGNGNMIIDAYDILKEKGIVSGRIHAEVFF